MLRRRQAPNRIEPDWNFFSFGLFPRLCSSYIALRLLYYLEPLTTLLPILQLMVEVVEKSLKIFVIINSQTATASTDSSKIGHNVEMWRVKSAAYNSLFDDPDIRELTKDLNDRDGKLYQSIRYGSEKTTAATSANLRPMMPVVDKIFFNSILLLPMHIRHQLHYLSPIKQLLSASPLDQSRNGGLTVSALKQNNSYIDRYVTDYTALDAEHEEELKKLGI